MTSSATSMCSHSSPSWLEVKQKSEDSSPPSPLFRITSSSITFSPSTSTSEDSSGSDLQWRRKGTTRHESDQPPFPSINLLPLPPLLLVILLPFYLLSTFPTCSANPNPSQQSTTTASSRVVKTKYGALRGFYINFPNKALPPVEAFLGKF